jgi:hypothetical protein
VSAHQELVIAKRENRNHLADIEEEKSEDIEDTVNEC